MCHFERVYLLLLSPTIQAPPSVPAPPPPTEATEEAAVNKLSDKEMKQRLKVCTKGSQEMHNGTHVRVIYVYVCTVELEIRL